VEIIIAPDADSIGELVADAVAARLAAKPDLVFGVATGGTPLPVYTELARRVAAGDLSFADATIVQLDEYVGLPAGHPESYRAVIRREVLEPLGIAGERFIGPDGTAEDVAAECAAYEEKLHGLGGVDIQLLGIGADGHIGFNEPGSSLASRTRIKTLTAQTIRDNARFFASEDEVPVHVITQGIGTVLEARHLILVARGENKAEAVALAFEGPLTAAVPASALQLHAHATVVVDEAAASQLKHTEYYRSAHRMKPAWQGV
jgi:glucosamine-6-phosphate deaminase